MKFWFFICIVTFVDLLSRCDGNKHTFGEDITTRTSYQRTLIYDFNKVPKNYTIIYRYLGAKYKEVAYLEIDVNVESSGNVYATNGQKTINAKIHIDNALNVTATIQIRFGVIQPFPYVKPLAKDYETKSLTFIYTKNANKSKEKSFAQNAIGRKRKNDKLIYFESRNVTNLNRFPSTLFEYSGSDYITFVGFSFNSPTAMVMVNTSFVGEQEFSAIVYDMNTEQFVANMTVYGYMRSSYKPSNFEGLIKDR